MSQSVQEFGSIVTIAIGLNIVNAAAPQPLPVPPADARGDFAALIALGSGTTDTAAHIAPGSIVRVDNLPAQPAADTLVGDLLGALLEKLEALTAGRKSDDPLDEDLLADIAALLDRLDPLLETGALPLPETPAFDTLVALARELGLAPQDGEGVNPLDILSKLATRIADAGREQSPEIAGRLGALARVLDGQSAAIETALANAAPDADMRRHLLATEAQPDAAKALRQANETPPNAPQPEKSAAGNTENFAPRSPEGKPDSTPRSLVADNGTPERPLPEGVQNKQGAQAAAGAASIAAADPDALTEAPDGLTIAPAQTGTAAHAAASARPAAAAYQRPDPQINMPHIAVEIARSIQNGINRFEIRLNPPELGRIDVRLEVDPSGNVIARLAVERSETLDLMQRDQRTLERALAEAGLDGNKTDLEFSLQQQDLGKREAGEKQAWRADPAATEEPAEPALQPDAPYRGYARLDAVNLWV